MRVGSDYLWMQLRWILLHACAGTSRGRVDAYQRFYLNLDRSHGRLLWFRNSRTPTILVLCPMVGILLSWVEVHIAGQPFC